MIRLIALDLDGTLLAPDSRVAPVDAEAVALAKERGVQIVLSTARWYGIAQRTAVKLGIATPLICFNGAHIQEPEGGEELQHLSIGRDEAREIAAFCDKGGYETITTVNGVSYMRGPWEDRIDPKRLPKDMLLAKNHAEFVTDPATGILVFGEEACQAVLGEFADRHAGAISFPYGSSEGTQPYLTITDASVNKGRSLQLVCQHLGVELTDVMAMGDAEPDVPMFDLAGVSVAMGNAPAGVQARADAVAPSNAEGGVAWAIRRFVLDAN